MRKLKERLIALLCIVSVTCTLCTHGIPAAASGETITLENAPEATFDGWTFSDVGIKNQTIQDTLNWVSPKEDAKSMDKTIFHGEILFPAGNGADFGNLYIGGSATETSKYNGFLIVGHTNASISLKFQDNGGAAIQIKNFYSSTAGVNIRGNEKLHFSLSTEILSEQDGIATVKIGVFFNGKLYNNEYYTVSNIPASVLTQHVRMRYATNGPKVASILTLDNVPEAAFDVWTFSSVGLRDQVIESELNWTTSSADAKSLDKTIFHGKVLIPGTGNDCGNFYIGGSSDASDSKYSGFLIRGAASNAISLTFQDNGGSPITIKNFYSETAEASLRGNENLQISLSVEILSETEGKATVKLGVFFNGKLYNNEYYTVSNLSSRFLKQHIKWKYAANSPKIQSIVLEDVTLENAPEREFASWTFIDAGLQDNPAFHSSMNWNEFPTEAEGAPLDKTLFQGKMNFDAVSNFGLFVIGGNHAVEASKNRGFRFESYGTTDCIALGFWGPDGYFYNANGNTGTQQVTGSSQIAIFRPEIAGVTLRGNSDLLIAFSVEYISEVTAGKVDIRIGVFFDGKLYNNTYYTVKGIPEAFLRQNVRFNLSGAVPGVSNGIASYPEEAPKEDIYLKNTAEKDFACWTFDDLGIDDQYLSVHLNWGDEWKKQTIGNSLDKTIFNGLINFPSDTENFGNFYLGGASKSEESKWRGFVFVANGTTDRLGLGFVGPQGMFYNKNGNTGSGSMSSLFAIFDPEAAGVALRGNNKLQLSLSVEYTAVTETTADLKVGVFFDGKLYNSEYYTLKDIPLEYLNQNIRFYAVGPNNEIASQHLCGKTTGGEFEGVNETYEELTLRDFSILNAEAESIETGKDFRRENYCDLETLNGTAVSVVCNFPKNGSARFSVGGSFWRGIYVGSRTDGRLELCYVNKEGDLKRLTYLDGETAGMESLTGRDITVRLTFDVITKGKVSDLRIGIYLDGTMYGGKHYIVRNADTETLTRTFKIYAVDVPFKVQSIKTRSDLSIYGFDNKTWQDRI